MQLRYGRSIELVDSIPTWSLWGFHPFIGFLIFLINHFRSYIANRYFYYRQVFTTCYSRDSRSSTVSSSISSIITSCGTFSSLYRFLIFRREPILKLIVIIYLRHYFLQSILSLLESCCRQLNITLRCFIKGILIVNVDRIRISYLFKILRVIKLVLKEFNSILLYLWLFI